MSPAAAPAGEASPARFGTPTPTSGAATVSPRGVLAAPGSPGALGVDYANPAQVAAAYVRARWTYTATDTAGYLAAQTAPELTTAAFAAASTPSAQAVARAQGAHESCTVTVTAAALSAEAPQSATTSYASVAFTTTDVYDGAASGTAERHLWGLRLVNTAPTAPATSTAQPVQPVQPGQPGQPGQPSPAAHWLVDGVVLQDG